MRFLASYDILELESEAGTQIAIFESPLEMTLALAANCNEVQEKNTQIEDLSERGGDEGVSSAEINGGVGDGEGVGEGRGEDEAVGDGRSKVVGGYHGGRGEGGNEKATDGVDDESGDGEGGRIRGRRSLDDAGVGD
ncbi:uncharacterized protein A4U43_C04F18560 [Asparagus officinalis]|uniref:Uncharacterized protein n=1 Tax=Asparagus officinalis TaxID=4686 RepID=A0A5P1F1Y2_ASPOF|nr:uncharacterized protein A4U43_C04F18560 [Asparagus officinalis]